MKRRKSGLIQSAVMMLLCLLGRSVHAEPDNYSNAYLAISKAHRFEGGCNTQFTRPDGPSNIQDNESVVQSLSSNNNLFSLRIPSSSDYSVNLMWLNKDSSKLDARDFIFPDFHENVDLKERIFEWAERSPGSEVNIWFDSGFVSKKQIRNTEKLFSTFNSTHQTSGNVGLKDIRALSSVNSYRNQKLFSHPDIPVYFKADLFRVMATLETLQTSNRSKGAGATGESPENYFTYADFDVTPMPRLELFDHDTLVNLNKFGIVVASKGIAPTKDLARMENSFHIVRAGHKNVHEALQTAVVETSLINAEHILDKTLHLYGSYLYYDTVPQMVYGSYAGLFPYLYHLEGYGVLTITQYVLGEPKTNQRGLVYWPVLSESAEPYDKARDGLSPFISGYAHTPSLPFKFVKSSRLPSNRIRKMDPDTFEETGEWIDDGRLYVPSKDIIRPLSRCCGYY